MIKKYKLFFRQFKEYSGHWVLSSSIASKILGFILSIIIIRVLDPQEYGVFSFASSIIAFVLPLNGMGLNHSLLRFGAIEKSNLNKTRMMNSSVSFGLLFTLITFCLLMGISFLVNFKLPGTNQILLFLSLQIFGLFIIDVKKVYSRILNKNSLFALIEFVQVLSNFVLSVIAVLIFGLWGYIFAIITAPILAFLITRKFKFNFSLKKFPNFKEHISYGLNIGFGSIASSLLFYADILLLGILIPNAVEIAYYKTASIIPIRLIFIPVAFLSIYYVLLAKNYTNRKEILKIVLQYCMVIYPLAIILFFSFYFFSAEILEFLFGIEYRASDKLFQIFIFVIPASFFLRALFGNALAALGKSSWNAKVAWLILILNIPLSYLAIEKFGAEGAAVVTVSLVVFSGVIMGILFMYYLSTLKEEKYN